MKHLNKMGSKTLTSSQGDTCANHSLDPENKEHEKDPRHLFTKMFRLIKECPDEPIPF